MSENNPILNQDTPAMTGADSSSGKSSLSIREWTYSGKAMRTRCVLYWIITLALVSLVGFLMVKDKLGSAFWPAWGIAIVIAALLWTHFLCSYFYRTWTIRYRLTEHQLDTIQGFFTKTTDTMELLNIVDLRLVVTLWDRLLNGGVGTIIVCSSTDKTNPELHLLGVENPQEMFDILNTARAEVRKKRALISG